MTAITAPCCLRRNTDMTLLEAMYRGTIGFFGELHCNTKDYSEALNAAIRTEDALLEQYPECKALFEAYRTAQLEVSSIAEYEQFALGFRAGAQLMLEMLKR